MFEVIKMSNACNLNGLSVERTDWRRLELRYFTRPRLRRDGLLYTRKDSDMKQMPSAWVIVSEKYGDVI